MRSHARVGSTDANFATMGETRGRLRLLAAAVVVLAALVLGVAALAAAAPLPVLEFGSSGTEGGQLRRPGGVAVDPATGNVFVADTENNRIQEFGAEGAFVRAWGWGVLNNRSELQSCQFSFECQVGLPGGGAGQLNEPVAVAVAPDGDVYALNRARSDGRVLRFEVPADPADPVTLAEEFGGYDETGTDEAKFATTLPNGNALAVDAAGNLYVADQQKSRVAKFGPTGTFLESISGEGTITSPQSVAVDAAGNLYVGNSFSGVAVVAADGTKIAVGGTKLFAAFPGVAVDEADGHVYGLTQGGFGATTEYVLRELDPAVLVGEPGAEEMKEVSSSKLAGMAPPVSESEAGSWGFAFSLAASFAGSEPGAFYLADHAAGKIRVYANPVAGEPTAGPISATSVGSGAANLNASVNPHGADTHVFFRYGTVTAAGAVVPGEPGQDIGAGFEPVAVSLHVSGLTPNTTYHFQLVAANTEGTFESLEGIFTTAATGGPVGLPDGRAYELVSVGKGLNDVTPEGISAPDGNGVTFNALNGLVGSPSGVLFTSYAARRGADGWSYRGASPPDLNQTTLAVGPVLGFSEDLGQSIATSKLNLTGNAPAAVRNLFIRDLASGAERLATPFAPRNSGFGPTMIGATADFSRVFLQTSEELTPDSPESGLPQLYEYSGGTLRNIGLVPGEAKPVENSVEASSTGGHPVSHDGSRIFFATPPKGALGGEGTAPQVFMRDTVSGAVVEVSASQAAVEDPKAKETIAGFVGAAADGSSVFFTSAAKLTNDANTGTGDAAPNLYRYDVGSGQLTDLSVATLPEDEALGANVLHVLVADGGNSAYFSALGNLAPGATSGAVNLYHWTAGQPLRFVATLGFTDSLGGGFEPTYAANRTTADGSVLALTATEALDPAHPDVEGIREIYRYAAASGSLACVTCNGRGNPQLETTMKAPPFAWGSGGNVLSADGGRIFFETPLGLVPQDTNGKIDTYEWEDGALHLISTGQSGSDSKFLDASPSGNDVFFGTREQLVTADGDEALDVYDARVGGGFPGAPAAGAPCEAEACRPPLASPPAPPPAASRSFNGPHNQKPKRHHKKHKKKKHHKKGKKCKPNAKKCAKKSDKGRSAGKRG